MRRRIWASGLVITILTLSVVAAFQLTERSSTSGRPMVGTFLYLWYGYNSTDHRWTGGLGTSHWNDTSSGLVKDRPSLGYYASLDNKTLGIQLSEMKAAGISMIIVSWWGRGNATQSGNSATLDGAINNATLNLFRYLESTKGLWNFKVALMVEPFNSSYDMTPHDYVNLYGYVYTNYYKPFNNLAMHWQGKPLLLSFNAPWSDAGRLPWNDSFTYRLVGSSPNSVDWYFWVGMNFLDASGGNAQPQNYASDPTISGDGEVAIAPRYDDYYLWSAGERPGFMRFDYRMSEQMYSAEWHYVLGQKSGVRLVLLYSWNEYHERTAIEPHSDFTATVNSTYLTTLTTQFSSELAG